MKAKPMTTMQKRVARDMVANGGIDGKLLAKAGYSKAIQKNPNKVRNSQAFQELVREKLPDDKLLKTHEEALSATKVHGTDSDFIEIPDHAIRLKAVELGYKLKGQLIDRKDGQITINVVGKAPGYKPPERFIDVKPIA